MLSRIRRILSSNTLTSRKTSLVLSMPRSSLTVTETTKSSPMLTLKFQRPNVADAIKRKKRCYRHRNQPRVSLPLYQLHLTR